MANRSIKHHYIPQFYIRGFANDQRQIWFYNKNLDKIEDRPQSPKSRFYTDELNAIVVGSEKKDGVEKIFQVMEDFSKDIIFKIRDGLDFTPFQNFETSIRLMFFAIHLYWRSPANNKNVEALIEKFRKEYGDWPIFQNPLFQSPKLFKKHQYKLIKQALPNDIIYNASEYMKGAIYYSHVGLSENLIITDNPVIYASEPKNKEDFISEIIFPIAKDKIFIRASFPFRQLETEDFALINQILIEQSSNYVGCFSKSILEGIVATYRSNKRRQNVLPNMRQSLFTSIEFKNPTA